MLNFLSQLFKNKKTTFFIFIFACIIISAPQIALAFSWNPLSLVSEIGSSFLNALIYLISFVPLFLTALFADIAGTLLKWAIALVTQGVSYTHSPGVNIGWPLVRDLANMFVVMGFVVVGIAFTLRIESYGSKKVLINLIIAALLINFSLLFCGIFIDGTNIAMNFFFSKIGNKAFTLQNTANSLAMVQNVPQDSWTAFLPKVVSLMIFNFFEFFIFLLYIILILGRVVALWTLVILSPLAFVCYVFPFSRPIWNMWWKNFFQWCIIGVPAGLFLYIGSAMITKMVETPSPTFVSDSGFFTAETIQTLSGFASFLLPGLFLIMGFLISLQFSAMGASTIMNFANKNKGKFMGAGLGALSKMSGKGGDLAGKLAGSDMLKGGGSKYNPLTWAKATARGAARTAEKGGHMARDYRASAQKTRSTLGRLGEKTGLVPTSTTAMKEGEIVKKDAERIKFEYNRAKETGDKKTVERIRGDAILAAEGKGGLKTSASMKVITEAGDLRETFKDSTTGRMDINKASKALTHAAGTGALDIKKEAIKKAPELARHDKPTIKKILDNHPGWSQPDAEHEAVVRAFIKVPDENLDLDLANSVDHKVIRDAGERMTNKRKEIFKRNVQKPIEDERKALAPTPAAASRLSPQDKDKWRELARKSIELRHF